MEKKLQVKNLRVSFRTQNGKVQAVRDISFDLNKGETLAIVGESGSGKSVTSKSILGILAGNAIVEGGEILYDGQDLLKISESDFHSIRGDKIAMIFQDPLSSLNPIVRVGKQLTEAMLLKGKQRQKNCRKDFNDMLARLKKNINFATAVDNPQIEIVNDEKIKNFNKFEYKHIELENAYNVAYEAASESVEEFENIAFEIEKKALTVKVAQQNCKILSANALKAIQRYVVYEDAQNYADLINESLKAAKEATDAESLSVISENYYKAAEILKKVLLYDKPNFFAMGYYLTFCDKPLPELDVKSLNKFLRKYLDDNYMLDFISLAKEGIKYSHFQSVEKKKKAISACEKYISVFQKQHVGRKELLPIIKKLSDLVEDSIDRLAIKKDNTAYTFALALQDSAKFYFSARSRNKKEEKRFAKDSAKYNKIVSKGKIPDWTVIPAAIIDIDLAREKMCSIIERILKQYKFAVEHAEDRNLDEDTVAMIDYLKEKASGVVYKVSKSMAKHKAIKLMEEVGISEPHKRYRQYPFEFSGGMCQRIVIAIALAANPDILICDEPTTALDVTIQAQILELINKLKAERNLSVIFITHDLGVVANMADRIAVMYAGKIVEYGTADDIFYSPAHPYTWALLSSMPDLATNEKLDAIPGTPPNMIYPPKGDAFAARNKYAMKIDFERQPPMFKITDTHYAATWLLHPDAPKIQPPKQVTDRIERMKKLEEAQQ